MFREGSFSWFKRDKTDEGEKTKRISSSGDGVNVDAHPLADVRAEMEPYKHTDKPVTFEKGDVISTLPGTGNPEEMMMAEEEAEKDPYAEYNAQGKVEKDKNNDNQDDDEIYADMYAGEIAERELSDTMEKDKNDKKEALHTVAQKYSRESLKENTLNSARAMEKKEKGKESNMKVTRDKVRGKWHKPESKNRPTGIRKILGK